MQNIAKELREALKLTVNELCKTINSSAGTVKLLEAGLPIKPSTAQKFADFYGITVDELLGRQPFDLQKYLAKKAAADKPKEPSMPNPNHIDIEIDDEAKPKIVDRPSAIAGLGIKHVIRVASTSVNYYLDAGWILLDAMSNPNGSFYCLLGNTKKCTNEDFERIKNANKSKNTTSYWMRKG